ncbi:hypothetical protein KUV65_00865 [Maritalea mobilis]|uniref:hypothetical protein n=1 Tax=Maritalea mobilis TaxID=483324 RepID=UPI001C96C705|nr:hypothetical protein [Maritalea mobilis]MBY6199900.1 hypothetical protein [Maritalea mobilis]
MTPLTLPRVVLRAGAAAALALGLGVTVAAAQTCPNVGLSGRALSYSAGQLVGGGQTVNVMAGGNIDLGACASVPGHGWIIEAPDFELMLNAMPPGQSLTLSVDGTCDAVLLVNDARGQWHYNDDAGGSLDPSITIPGASNGLYDIWVGTFGSATCPATLTLRASGTGAAPPPPPSNAVRFDYPRVNGELVDWCVTWATNCGQGGADNFCRSQGFSRAASWERYPGQRTLVLGDNRIYPGGCDALRNVVCTGTGGGGVAPPPPPSVQQTFAVPRVNGEIVDWCVTWATDCGQPGADNFCRTQGFSRAASWERYPGQRTLVLGDNRICGGGCDGLRNVVCTN